MCSPYATASTETLTKVVSAGVREGAMTEMGGDVRPEGPSGGKAGGQESNSGNEADDIP
jgi:hypothetical protein